MGFSDIPSIPQNGYSDVCCRQVLGEFDSGNRSETDSRIFYFLDKQLGYDSFYLPFQFLFSITHIDRYMAGARVLGGGIRHILYRLVDVLYRLGDLN